MEPPEQSYASKKILSTSSAFGHLRKSLIDNMGTTRVKGFLLRYGWSLGVSDAEEAMKIDTNFDFLISQASVLHSRSGQISNVQSERFLEMDDDQNIISFNASGKWIDSFEVYEHLKHYGQSDEPVCHTLTGYASGYMSTICHKKVIVKETSCIGKGDDECLYEVRLEEDWGNEIQDVIKFYNEKHIVDELEFTYEQLLEQRNYIDKVSTFHTKLTEYVSNGSDLQSIADASYQLLGIPVTIEDLSFQKIVYSGINETEYMELSKDFMKSLDRKGMIGNRLLPTFHETMKLHLAHHDRLVTPIIVQKKRIGYCTFIYSDHTEGKSENDDFMFIERLANAASLILLNEKTSFEAIEKMKGYLLEEILKGQFSSKEEIINRGRYMGFNFEDPYYVVAIAYHDKMTNLKNSKDYYEQILETIVKFFDIKGRKALIGRHDSHIILLIPGKIEKNKILRMSEQILDHMEKTNTTFRYQFGISNQSENIEDTTEHLEEAIIALRMSNNREITDYQDLGIVGVLINSGNINGVKKFAKQELGPLYKMNDVKRMELIKTLYVFLSNGVKLHQTMQDLSLSMSGLTYRINKIESLLEKDLRDPQQSYQLLLILDSLVALGELEI